MDEADESLALAGAEFTLYDEQGNALMSVLTDQNGLASFVVTQGSYSLKETKAPEGYVLESDPIEVGIDDQYDETKLYEITMTNRLLPDVPTGDNENTTMLVGLVVIYGTGAALLMFRRQSELE